jgi:hypothetical protein
MKLVLFLKNNNIKIRNTSTINLHVNNNLKMIIYKSQKDREIMRAIQSLMKFHNRINNLKKIKR